MVDLVNSSLVNVPTYEIISARRLLALIQTANVEKFKPLQNRSK